MDPDLVREQQEAEREALAQRKKQMAAAPPYSSLQTPAEEGAAFAKAEPQSRKPAGFASLTGRFLSYAAAGAILGLAVGNAVESFWNLNMVVFGTTAVMATLCGVYGLISRQ
ncbi:MAG TPA: hypothetical protein VE986_00275 [Hyphomicrobiales bacterium]|nr:hypothetical protein [Hyphomicrobiales bacterium]